MEAMRAIPQEEINALLALALNAEACVGAGVLTRAEADFIIAGVRAQLGLAPLPKREEQPNA